MLGHDNRVVMWAGNEYFTENDNYNIQIGHHQSALTEAERLGKNLQMFRRPIVFGPGSWENWNCDKKFNDYAGEVMKVITAEWNLDAQSC